MVNPFQKMVEEGEGMSDAEREAEKKRLDRALASELEMHRQDAEKTARTTDRQNVSHVRPDNRRP